MSVLFFYPERIILIMFFVMICLFAAQGAFASVLLSNYRLKDKNYFIGECLMLGYIATIVLISVSVFVNKRQSMISVFHLDLLLKIIALLAILNFIFLIFKKTKGSVLAIIGIVATLLITVETVNILFAIIVTSGILVLFYRLIILIDATLCRQKNEITALSIIEGLDSLPCGVMFCDLNGYIFLTNEKMRELAIEFVKKDFKNSKLFWEKLSECSNSNAEAQIIDGDILIRTPDKAWRFSKQALKTANSNYIEIIAIDVSESIGAFYTLEEENNKLEKQNRELKKLAKDVQVLHREREFIKIRSRVHDVLGQRLTAIQRISQNDENPDYNTILYLAQDSVAQIKEKREDNAKLLYGEMYHYFYQIGLKIEIADEFPEDENIAFLFLSVLREACTNAVKHADATKVFVKIVKAYEKYRIEITNNGKQPDKSIVEGGGLFGIRNRVENAGGVLKVELIPEFSLIITLERSIQK